MNIYPLRSYNGAGFQLTGCLPYKFALHQFAAHISTGINPAITVRISGNRYLQQIRLDSFM